MAKRINWLKVVSNSGYIFFLLLVGFFSADKIYNLNMPFVDYLGVSALIAFVNAMLVFFLQLKEEAEEIEVEERAEINKMEVDSPKIEEKESDPPEKKNLLSMLCIF